MPMCHYYSGLKLKILRKSAAVSLSGTCYGVEDTTVERVNTEAYIIGVRYIHIQHLPP